MATQRTPLRPGVPFPVIPARWGDEVRHFFLELRDCLEQIRWQRAYPIGIVVLSASDKKPFTFGRWESIETGIEDIYGWKRVE